MKTNFLNKKLPAFTLTELLVVLVIVGILVMLALPNLMPLITKAKSTEAELQLNQIYTMEKTYQMTYSKFSNDFGEISFEAPKTVIEDGTANYQYEIIDASTNSFKARATAVADFDQDGTFDVWEIDQDKKLINTVKD
jgi:type IV pilus assembly protein PilE